MYGIEMKNLSFAVGFASLVLFLKWFVLMNFIAVDNDNWLSEFCQVFVGKNIHRKRYVASKLILLIIVFFFFLFMWWSVCVAFSSSLSFVLFELVGLKRCNDLIPLHNLQITDDARRHAIPNVAICLYRSISLSRCVSFFAFFTFNFSFFFRFGFAFAFTLLSSSLGFCF